MYIYIYIYRYICICIYALETLTQVNASLKLFCLYSQTRQFLFTDAVYDKGGNGFYFLSTNVYMFLYVRITLPKWVTSKLNNYWTLFQKNNVVMQHSVNIYISTISKSMRQRAFRLRFYKNLVEWYFHNITENISKLWFTVTNSKHGFKKYFFY